MLRVNGTSVETAVHQEVVDMIKCVFFEIVIFILQDYFCNFYFLRIAASNMVELFLQRANTSKITAPIPVDVITFVYFL